MEAGVGVSGVHLPLAGSDLEPPWCLERHVSEANTDAIEPVDTARADSARESAGRLFTQPGVLPPMFPHNLVGTEIYVSMIVMGPPSYLSEISNYRGPGPT